ncbi:MAG: hypothetical protein HY954_02840 [Deltaproteobacteria bacterium]|nr:hypothetical protein [Deltaproteobacteria bacterium]
MRRYLTAFAYILFILFHPALIHAGELITVQSEGAATKTGDAAEEKRKAIDKALKNAVNEALSSYAKKEGVALTRELSEEILSNPRAFILNYKVVSEGWVSHLGPTPLIVDNLPEAGQSPLGVELFHIWIEASIDDGALREAFGKAAAVKDASSIISINIVDVTDYSEYKELIGALKRIALLNGVSYSTFSRGKITLHAKSGAGVGVLIERISKEIPENYIATAGGPETIIIKAAPKVVQ